MKPTFLLLTLLISNSLDAQLIDRTFQSSDGALNILGYTSISRLKSAPFLQWYEESHQAYEVQEDVLSTINLPDSITIFMGTWCGDSRREVPRFIKLLEAKSYDLSKVQIISLNSGFQNYKQAPEREEAGLYIHRVPTFIFYDEVGSELGRIVEEPVRSLEQDLKDVIEEKNYQTAYPLAAAVIEKLKSLEENRLMKSKTSLRREFQGKVNSAYELNTFGYVLWASFDLIKAEFVLELNSELFPDSIVPFRTLAKFKQMIGKNKDAVDAVKKGLSIDPSNAELLRLKAILDR